MSIGNIQNNQTPQSVGSMTLDMEICAVQQNSKKRRVISELQIGVEGSTDGVNKTSARQSTYKAIVQGVGAVAMTGCKIAAVVTAGANGNITSNILDGIADHGAKYATDGILSGFQGREATLGGRVQRTRSNEEALKKSASDEQAFLQSHELTDRYFKTFAATSA